MQKLSDLSKDDQSKLLRRGELRLKIGPYVYNLQSDVEMVAEGLGILYSDFSLAGPENFTDYHIALRHDGLRSRLLRNVDFFFEGQRPFNTIRKNQAYAFMEWGMNWCVSVYANEYLKLHAAVVAKNGLAIIMPGIPGAGKSTLCAALGLSGWRVLSDEHALIPPGTAEVVPLYRPVSLKNESIDIIREFNKAAVFGPISTDTHKGVVAHLKADLESDSHSTAHLPVSTIVFPRYSADEPEQLSRTAKTQSFILASYHSFNYSLLGPAGFHSMMALLDSVRCYDLIYRDLEWAIHAMDDLHSGAIG